MITQERLDSPQPTPPNRRRLAAALGAAAVLIAAVTAVAILVNGSSGVVAAADADPVVVFDGTTCSYEGPTLIEEGLVEFSLTNSAAEPMVFVSWLMEEPALSQALAAAPVGTDWAPEPGEPMPAAPTHTGVPAGESFVSGWAMEPGTYLFDCALGVRGLQPDHWWRIAKVEIVASG